MCVFSVSCAQFPCSTGICRRFIKLIAFGQDLHQRRFLRKPFFKLRNRNYIHLCTLFLSNRTAMIMTKLYRKGFIKHVPKDQPDHSIDFCISRNAPFPSASFDVVNMTKYNHCLVIRKFTRWSGIPKVPQNRIKPILQIFNGITFVLGNQYGFS